jgi:hypothetical protein
LAVRSITIVALWASFISFEAASIVAVIIAPITCYMTVSLKRAGAVVRVSAVGIAIKASVAVLVVAEGLTTILSRGMLCLLVIAPAVTWCLFVIIPCPVVGMLRRRTGLPCAVY